MFRSFFLCLLSLSTATGECAQGVSSSIDYIRGEGQVEGVKLAAQYHSDALKRYADSLQLYFEASINFWDFEASSDYDSNFVLSISPVIQYPIAQLSGSPLFIEFGIGLSLLDDTKFAGKDVSTHYQFEDRLGVSTRFGTNQNQQIALRYFHYSNGGLKKPNPGLDFISLSYMYFY